MLYLTLYLGKTFLQLIGAILNHDFSFIFQSNIMNVSPAPKKYLHHAHILRQGLEAWIPNIIVGSRQIVS